MNLNLKPGMRTGVSVLIALTLGASIIFFAQSRAPESDFQIANMISILVGLVTALFVIIQLHRLCRAHLHWLIVPLAVVSLVGFAVVRYQWVGFSGEMMPQFRDRFAVAPELQTESVASKSQPASATKTAIDSAGSIESAGLRDDETNATESETSDSNASNATPAAVAIVASPQFLGPNRNAVIENRSFEVPTDNNPPREVWRIGVGEGWSSFAVANDRAVTIEQRNDQEWLTCYRLADGKLLWSCQNNARHENALGGIGPRSTPSIVDDRVYAQSATGFLWCVNVANGEILWSVDLLDLAGWTQAESESVTPWGRAASPLLIDGLCIIPFGLPETDADAPNRSLIAFDAADGTEKWRAGEDQISYASPVLMHLADRQQIVSVNEKTVTGHEIQTGKTLWSFSWPGQSNGGANCASAIAVDDDHFLVGKGYGGGSAKVRVMYNADSDQFSTSEVWASSRILKTKFTHACIKDDIAYAISNGILQAADINDPELIWSQSRRDRAGSGQILLAEDVIVVQNESGEVNFVRADPDTYRIQYSLDALDSKTWNIPTIAGRHLLVRNDHEAICFLLPERPSSAIAQRELQPGLQ
tara:strand:- start:128302 stop:130068 length:1767 start_codon:yes stop_codon:yes gene_type:complete